MRKVEYQALHICIPLSSKAFFSTAVSLGYLLPTSQPVKPARAISDTHCSNVFSAPRSGMSSLVHAMGAMPRRTFCLSNISISSLSPDFSAYFRMLPAPFRCRNVLRCPHATRPRIRRSWSWAAP